MIAVEGIQSVHFVQGERVTCRLADLKRDERMKG